MTDLFFVSDKKLCGFIRYLIERCDLPLEEVSDPPPVLTVDWRYKFNTRVVWKGYGGYLFFGYIEDPAKACMFILPPEYYHKAHLLRSWRNIDVIVAYQYGFLLSKVIETVLKASFGTHVKVSRCHTEEKVRLLRRGKGRGILLIAKGKFVRGGLDKLRKLMPKIKADIIYNIA